SATHRPTLRRRAGAADAVPVPAAGVPGLRRVRAVPAGQGRAVLPVRVEGLRLLHLRGARELRGPRRGRGLPRGDPQRPRAHRVLRGDPAGGGPGAGGGAAARPGAGDGLLPHRDLPAAGDRPGVVAVAWRQIYAPGGLLNDALRAVGLDVLTRGWLGDPGTALAAVGFIGTWVEMGLVMLLMLSGMSRIPAEQFEAARLDGAGAVREFFAITLPAVRGEITVALVLTIIAALKTFDLVYL